MKIVIAVHHFPPRYRAGAELRAYDMAAWLRKAGHDVHVICVERIDHGPDDGLSWEDGEYEGISVRRLSFNLSKAPDPFRWEYDNPWIEEHLRNFLAHLKPDIFHLVSGYLLGAGTLRAARALEVPIVVTLTDYWFLCPRINLLRSDDTPSNPDQFDATVCARCKLEEKRRFRLPAKMAPRVADWFWERAFEPGWRKLFAFSTLADQFRQRNQTLMEMLLAADALICPSRFLVEKFSARGIPSHRLILNPHGLDTSGWLPVSENGRSPSIFRIGYLGQIVWHKGVHLLVEAFTRLRSGTSLELVIYGNDAVFPEYTRRLRKLAAGDKRVKILGRFNYQDLAQMLAQMDVLVVPSTWNEIGPLVLYEAFQAKTPVVATNIPNMSYLVQHEKNGLLFDVGDSADLASQLQRLIDEPDLLSRLRDGIGPVKSLAEEMDTLQRVYHSLHADF
jgi:glycosyltransferase involved in cell wall biosynthesis